MAVLTIPGILELLGAGPARIRAAAVGIDDATLSRGPAPGSWSANDILAHLRSCNDVWGDAIETILRDGHPTIRATNPRTWIERTDYPNLPFGASFQAFADQRARLINVLSHLDPGAWDLSATIVGAGKPLRRSVRGYAEWLVTHERPHIRQVERAAAGLP